MGKDMPKIQRMEWPTLVMLGAAYGVWIFGTFLWARVGFFGGVVAIILIGVAIAQFSSLQHEVLHGHPFKWQWLNEALVFPAILLFIPYLRFKDTHLQHHYDPALTDPYDDPESNFLDPEVWGRTHMAMRGLLLINNTLLGRMLVGPGLGCYQFLRSELALMVAGNRRVQLAWVLNMIGVAMVIVWLNWVKMSIVAYFAAVYIGVALLKIRTFLEHRAHNLARARTVIIESRGPLSYLFLNNNFHAVHHMHPNLPWYVMPQIYAARRDHYQQRNDAYMFRSYVDVFRQYFLKAKDPVPHPIWPVNKGAMTQDDREENPRRK
jgi:fatty acid desaturase